VFIGDVSQRALQEGHIRRTRRHFGVDAVGRPDDEFDVGMGIGAVEPLGVVGKQCCAKRRVGSEHG
jgi:hypothetical protein